VTYDDLYEHYRDPIETARRVANRSMEQVRIELIPTSKPSDEESISAALVQKYKEAGFSLHSKVYMWVDPHIAGVIAMPATTAFFFGKPRVRGLV